jgi:hypothetical protein
MGFGGPTRNSVLPYAFGRWPQQNTSCNLLFVLVRAQNRFHEGMHGFTEEPHELLGFCNLEGHYRSGLPSASLLSVA